MEIVLLFLVLFTSFLLFMSLFQRLFLSDKRLEKRMKRYLEMSSGQGLQLHHFNMALQMQMTKQKIRKKVLTKNKGKKLETMLARAGVPLKPEEYVLFQWMIAFILGGLFYLLLGSSTFFVIGVITGFLLPRWWVQKEERKRIAKFNDSLADMITTIVGSLRAGFSFPQALKTVSEEADSPIKEEIESVLREMQYGSSIEEALHSLHDRMPSEDLELMIQAILIQRQVGGNLATVLEKIVETIRDRTKIQRQIKTLTAQGRLSGIVIGLLPVILGFVIYLIEPDYISALFKHPIGISMVTGGIISGIIGFIMIRKLTIIEV